MKKLLLKSLAMLCIAVTIGGCNKDGVNQSPEGSTIANRNALDQLRTFRNQMESIKSNLGTKNDETITLTDALWDVENYFNLTYSDAESYYSQINEHEFALSIPTDAQQQVLVADAVNLYDQVVILAREALLSEEFDNKGFLSLTVKHVSTDNRGTIITFSGKTGNRSNYIIPIAHIDGPFDVDDDWMFAAPMGKCDDPDIPSGADEQLQEQLYAELIEPFIASDAGYRNIYVDRRRFVFDGTTYNGVYYNENSDDLCIPYGYMNDYYWNEKRIITQTIPTQYHFYGLSPISIEIHGIGLGNNAVTHLNEIEYGIRMAVSKDEFGELEDLLIQQ